MLPVYPSDVVRGQYGGYRDEDGVANNSDTETFIALKVGLDNWRWAGVPFYLRTGKRMAEGMRIISIAFREAPRTMFPSGSGVGTQGPDHLTFDLADASRVSLSFYGKQQGPGMRLEKLSMQFSTQETEHAGDVLEAYERLILDAMRGDHTLFTTAEGIESLWERSEPLFEDPPPVKVYAPGSWGPNAIHQSSRRMPGGCPSSGPRVPTGRRRRSSRGFNTPNVVHRKQPSVESRACQRAVGDDPARDDRPARIVGTAFEVAVGRSETAGTNCGRNDALCRRQRLRSIRVEGHVPPAIFGCVHVVWRPRVLAVTLPGSGPRPRHAGGAAVPGWRAGSAERRGRCW